MNDSNLDILIARLKKHPLTDCPAGVEAKVLRRVRIDRARAEAGALDWIGWLLRRPAFLAGTMVLAGVLSSGVAALTAMRPGPESQKQLAARALDFVMISRPEILDFDER